MACRISFSRCCSCASVSFSWRCFLGWCFVNGNIFLRRFLALGPMRELGDRAPAEHESLGRDAASIADWAGVAIVAGPEPALADALARGFRDAGLPADRLFLADTHAPAAAWLASRMSPGDALLLKASRAIAMEKILPLFA